MLTSPCLKWFRSPLVAFGLLLGVVLTCNAEPGIVYVPTCLEELEHLTPCQLHDLYTHAEVGHPLVGTARGRLLYLTDKFPRIKVRMANSVWRGKAAEPDGYFVNRWVGNVRWIDSHYVIGPSWIDGKPAVVMEYPPGTKLFWNMHDELREISPGLYIGPVFERFPCPKLRGYIGLQLEACKDCGP
jgi:hypothetical protein